MSLIKNNRGVTMLEFTIGIIVIMPILLVLFDLSLFFYSKAILREGAKRIVREASVNFGLRHDIRKIPGQSPTTTEAQEFDQARANIINNALSFVHSTFIKQSTQGTQSLNQTLSYAIKNISTNNTSNLDALLLFPGESAEVRIKNANNNWVYEAVKHPTCLYNALPCSNDWNKVGLAAWEQILLTHPIYAELRSEYPSFLFGNMEVKASAYSWRELHPSGTNAIPQLLPTPKPTPSPIPEFCSDQFTEATFCASISCTNSNTHQCVFNSSGTYGNCGSCNPKQCFPDQYQSIDDLCNSLNCNLDTHNCTPNPTGTGQNCGSCTWKSCDERFGINPCVTNPCAPAQTCTTNNNPASCYTCSCPSCANGFYVSNNTTCNCAACTNTCNQYQIRGAGCSCVCKGQPSGGCPNGGLWNPSLCSCISGGINPE